MPNPIDNNALFQDDDSFFTQDAIQFPYIVEQHQTFYLRDEGTLQVPVGAAFQNDAPKIAAKIVRTSAPAERKMVYFFYTRIGINPVVPSSVPINDNERLSFSQVVPIPPRPYGQGDELQFSIWGVYIYDLYLPHSQANDQYTGGRLAGISQGGFTSPSDFDDSLQGGDTF